MSIGKRKIALTFPKDGSTHVVEVAADDLVLRSLVARRAQEAAVREAHSRPRRSHKPKVDAWIDRHLPAETKVLWKALPKALKKQVNYPGFASRVTDARKRAVTKNRR